MEKLNYFTRLKQTIIALLFIGSTSLSIAQTNVFDNIIALSPNHTYLKAALEQEGLDVALKNPAATLTVLLQLTLLLTHLQVH